MPSAYPYNIPLGFRFNVKISGITDDAECSFRDVSGISVNIELETFNEGGVNEYVHKLPKRAKYENLILKRGIMQGSSLIADWINKAIREFTFNPKQIDIMLLDEANAPTISWSLVNAYPVAIKISEFKAMENEIVVETLELAYNYFERTN
jgi:phage tail-like protein